MWLVLAVWALASVPEWSEAQDDGAPAPAESMRGRLLPGDLIQLSIWNEPELSGRFGIDENGIAVLPKIGRVDATTPAPDEVKATILTGLARYLRNPSIEVIFLRRVNILGAVREPGVYPLDPTITIAEALAQAGGTTPEGRTDVVEIHRGGEVLMNDVRQLNRISETPLRSGDQLYVPERSWFSRNTAIVATGISAAVSIFIALIR